MALLDEQQRQRAKEVLNEYLSAPLGSDGKTHVENSTILDENRIRLIDTELKPLLSEYLIGNLELTVFKSKVDSINKVNPLWGFKGIKGQMFFNMVVNVADDMDECNQELKSALTVPPNEQIASSRIKTFSSYVKRLGDKWVDAGNTRYGCPKIGSITFFLTYFWQIQDRDTYPVYYTNSVQKMTDLNLWQPTGDSAQDYLTFKHIHEELSVFFKEVTGKKFNLYQIEHVFWYKGGNPYEAIKSEGDRESGESAIMQIIPMQEKLALLPESYVPPIVAILPLMAINDESLIEASKKSGTSLERAFEKYINAALTILGYQTQLLGQGKGSVPDGLAKAMDENYAIIWDAKVRRDGYSFGTDDRAIREYITKQSRDMKKGQSLRNIYYMIVSSKFTDEYDEIRSSIKMETYVNEVSLVEADALVAMVDAKLRDPHQINLGSDGLQRLFSIGGVITAKMVREQLIG